MLPPLTENPYESVILEAYASEALQEHQLAQRMLTAVQQRRLGKPARRAPLQVSVDTSDTIPPLAWLCEVSGGDHRFTVGRGVETGGDFVVEGVRDRPFGTPRHNTDFFFGSGAVFRQQVIFMPPKHCWEYLFVLHDRTGGRSLVSNSFNFILARAGIEPDDELVSMLARELRTRSDQATAVGIDRYDPGVAATGRYAFRRMMFHNFAVRPDGGISVIYSEPRTYFSTFAEYRTFLVRKLRRIFANATSPERRAALPPITSISGGYDLIAVSVLARDAGCRDALTMEVTVGGRDDSASRPAGRSAST